MKIYIAGQSVDLPGTIGKDGVTPPMFFEAGSQSFVEGGNIILQDGSFLKVPSVGEYCYGFYQQNDSHLYFINGTVASISGWDVTVGIGLLTELNGPQGNPGPKGDAGSPGPAGENGKSPPMFITGGPVFPSEGSDLSIDVSSFLNTPTVNEIVYGFYTAATENASYPYYIAGQVKTFTDSEATINSLSITNLKGPAGAKGDTGAQGPAGAKGDTGAQGPAGRPGNDGHSSWTGSGTSTSIPAVNDAITDSKYTITWATEDGSIPPNGSFICLITYDSQTFLVSGTISTLNEIPGETVMSVQNLGKSYTGPIIPDVPSPLTREQFLITERTTGALKWTKFTSTPADNSVYIPYSTSPYYFPSTLTTGFIPPTLGNTNQIFTKTENGAEWADPPTAQQTWSTTEQVIGTWTNGKPRYQICQTLTVTSQSVDAGLVYMTNFHSIPNVDPSSVIITSCFSTTSFTYTLPAIDFSFTYTVSWYKPGSCAQFRALNTTASEAKTFVGEIIAIITYCKTTD